MAARKKNPHAGSTLRDYVKERKAKDPEFAEAFDRLQLARAIKEARESRQVTQVELAARVGTGQSSIARIESGRVIPKLDVLQRVASSLGMRLEVKFVPVK